MAKFYILFPNGVEDILKDKDKVVNAMDLPYSNAKLEDQQSHQNH